MGGRLGRSASSTSTKVAQVGICVPCFGKVFVDLLPLNGSGSTNVKDYIYMPKRHM